MLKDLWSEIQILIVTSLSFVTALAWNSAFQHLFETTPFLKRRGPWIYALLVTLIGLALTYLLQRKIKDKEETRPS